MNIFKKSLAVSGLVSIGLISGCGQADEASDAAASSATDTAQVAETEGSTAATKPKRAVDQSPGKPSSGPFSFDYEVQGNPVVGQPVALNILVTSSMDVESVDVSFSALDASSLMFPPSQPLQVKVMRSPEDADGPQRRRMIPQQITFIPQREGRHYIIVSAGIETADGTIMNSRAVPIQVGSAPPEMEVNGELVETPEGETVISMPAQ